MRVNIKRADALRLAYAGLHGLFGFAYLLGTALSIGMLYGIGIGSSMLAGTSYLLTTTLPQSALPCAIALAPGVLAIAAGKDSATLGRLAWGMDAMLCLAALGAAIGYASAPAAVAAALLALAAALGARCWDSDLDYSIENENADAAKDGDGQ